MIVEDAPAPAIVLRSSATAWEPTRRQALEWLSVIIVVAATLRFPTLGQQSIWLDEAASYLQARGGFIEMLQATAKDNYPPLHNVLLWLSINIFGEAEWSLRLPSALAGLANVLAIYWVGALMGSRKAGLLAAILLALSAFHIFYSQEARMYAVLALAATLFAGTMIAVVQRGTARWLVAAAVAGIALLYSHPYGLLAWAAVLAGAFAGTIGRQGIVRPLFRFGLIAVASIAAFAPWATLFAQRAIALADGVFWIPPPTGEWVINTLDHLLSGQLALVAAVAVVGGAVVFRLRPSGWIIIAWALLPFVAAFAYSQLVQPIFLDRYCLAMLPALLLLAAHGMAVLAQTRVLLATVVVGLILSASYGLYAATPSPREDWRGVVAWLDRKMDRPNDCLVVAKAYMRIPLEYYRPSASCKAFVSVPDQLPKQGYSGRVFFVASHIRGAELADIIKVIESEHGAPDERHFRGVDLYTFEGPR